MTSLQNITLRFIFRYFLRLSCLVHVVQYGQNISPAKFVRTVLNRLIKRTLVRSHCRKNLKFRLFTVLLRRLREKHVPKWVPLPWVP